MKLSQKEIDDLRSQFVTANISSKSRVPPAVFSEHGVLMLANVLNSEMANNVSIQIIRIFTKMREMIVTQSEISISDISEYVLEKELCSSMIIFA